MSDARTRLKNTEQRLIAKGVVDVKFSYGPHVRNADLETVCAHASDLLEAILDGRTKPLQAFGDSRRVC